VKPWKVELGLAVLLLAAIPMAITLSYLLGLILACLVLGVLGPVLTVCYIRLLIRLESKRGTISATTEHQEE
jgi:hypothetical protein